MVWQDEMRVGLIGQVRRVWVPKDEQPRQAVEVTYEWEYLNLAVNGIEGTLTWAWEPNMKQASTVDFTQQLQAEDVTGVIWDGAPCHRAKSVRAQGVPVIQQPAYAPELNPAERVFEELRKAVEGQVYGELAKKRAAVDAVLEELAADPERLRSLTGWDWIRQTINEYSFEKESLD